MSASGEPVPFEDYEAGVYLRGTKAELAVGDLLVPGSKTRRRGVLSKIDPRTNEIVSSIELGFRPDGVAVEKSLVWVAIAPP